MIKKKLPYKCNTGIIVLFFGGVLKQTVVINLFRKSPSSSRRRVDAWPTSRFMARPDMKPAKVLASSSGLGFRV